MATGKGNETAGGASPVTTTEGAEAASERKLIVADFDDAERSPMTPMVFVRNRKKRGRKRYSRGTKEFQRLQRAFSKASYRVSKASTIGFRELERRSERSARRKRDGGMIDAPRNIARAVEDGLREASRAPVELARGIDGRVVWAPLKTTVRLFMPSRWRR
jgi:hypothetical protein